MRRKFNECSKTYCSCCSNNNRANVNKEERDLKETLKKEEYTGTLPRYFALIIGVADYKYEVVQDCPRFRIQ